MKTTFKTDKKEITATQLRVLIFLGEKERTVQELADEFVIAKVSAVAYYHYLHKKGYVLKRKAIIKSNGRDLKNGKLYRNSDAALKLLKEWENNE